MSDERLKALQKVGKTQFGTQWTAANALDPCLTHIRSLVINKAVKFKVHSLSWLTIDLLTELSIQNKKVQAMFANRHTNEYNEFEQGNLQYITIVAPLIRSLWSLEAAHANASDTFIFWLAIAASLKKLFAKGQAATGIDPQVARQVTAIFNKRYGEFFSNEVYFVAFTLDPRQSSFLSLAGAN